MSKVKITAVASVDPPHQYKTSEIVQKAKELWLPTMPEKQAQLALKIFHGAEIDSRFSVVPLDTVFADLTFEEKNDLYIEAVKSMATKTLKAACQKAEVQPNQIDYLITTSCTGFMIPSVDAYMVNELGMKTNIIRMPITEMGCAGGTSALTYAKHLLQGKPGTKAAVVAVEAPSVTFQKNDLSMENFVSTAIFADGAAAVIVENDTDKRGAEILDTEMFHFRDATHLMGYRLQNSGLKIILDREVPDAISSNFENFFYPVLLKQKLKIEDIQHFVFHPGGKKILQQVEKLLSPFGKEVNSAKAVLKERGNLSSATVLHVLEKTWNKTKTNDLGYMLAFGPGFSAQSLLLRW